ncbi:MAG: class I SAM-dependent methyltransferase [Thermodesulfobacteriota bacterium]|nr:class I SAM-dependent methyltransferase [Thermodesulfobacteriota bacterium]
MDRICWNWKHYFETRHEGLGTTYERFILHEYFRKIKDQYGVSTVLEAPIFGMTGISGINSMWWAMQGAQVTIVDNSRERLDSIEEVWDELSLKARLVYDPGTYTSLPFEDQEFDMSWNFAALNPDLKLEGLVGELARVTKKVVFVCLPNRLNPFGLIRKVMQKKTDLFQPGNMDPGIIQKTMTKEGWQIREKGYFDVPPWPDIAMPKEDFLRKIGLTRYAKQLAEKITEEKRICILDYYSGRKKEMKDKILKYAFLENSPKPLKSIWAHHRYYIFTPRHCDFEIRNPKSHNGPFK